MFAGMLGGIGTIAIIAVDQEHELQVTAMGEIVNILIVFPI